jgi:hypothetical protein
MLLLESQQKSRWIHWNKKEHSTEETSAVFSLGVFLWLNHLFLSGYKNILAINDLYPQDGAIDPTRLHKKFSQHLDMTKMKGDKYGLTKVLMRTIMGPLLLCNGLWDHTIGDRSLRLPSTLSNLWPFPIRVLPGWF